MKLFKKLIVAIITAVIFIGVYVGISYMLSEKESETATTYPNPVYIEIGKTYDLLDYYMGEDEGRENTIIVEILAPNGSNIEVPEKNEDGEILFTPENGTGEYKVTYEASYDATEEELEETGLVNTVHSGVYPFIVK